MRSLFPTCLFNASLDLPQVGLARGSLLVPVCPGIGDLNAACPLPWFESLDPGLASDPASPSGLAPSGSLRSLRFATEKLTFPNSPMSVAPRPVGTPPADRRSEFATASEAGCSSNLLEPIQLSSHSGIKVNRLLRS